MNKDERDLLDVLKSELAFLEKGGYGRSPRESWRQPHIFEDSPSCMNYDCKENPGPCSDCVLMQLVPPQFRGKEIPCRYISFTTEGETLDSLCRNSEEFETEEIFGKWLRTTIASIEQERQAALALWYPPPGRGVAGKPVEPLLQKPYPKCANPACPAEFRWLAGGKFFRFRPDPVASPLSAETTACDRGIVREKHYWLCEECSHTFTLGFDENQGVMLTLLWPELLAPEGAEELKERCNRLLGDWRRSEIERFIGRG